MRILVGAPGRALAWWRESRRRRPLVFGAIFWLVFWSVSAAAMVWVYSPGGLADPDRDLRSPSSRAKRPACVQGCATEEAFAATEDQEASVAALRSPVRSARKPSPTPSSSVAVTLPPLPTLDPPDVSIVVDEVLTLAGNRYLHYRVDLVAHAALGRITVSANVPEQTWFTECSDQAGQRVCADSYRGSGDRHQVSWTPQIAEAGRTTFEFWVHLDPTTEVGDDVVNHAHVGWGDVLVTSGTHVFTVPALIGS